LQQTTDGGPFGMAKEPTAIIRGQLYTAHTRRFAVGHPWNWRRDRGCNTAGSTASTTLQSLIKPPFCYTGYNI